MYLPIDYCPDPHSLARISQGLAEYEQISGLCALAAERGFHDFIAQQREAQRIELEKLATYQGNQLAQLTLAFFYLDNAFEGSMFRTTCRFKGTPVYDEDREEFYITRAEKLITQLLPTADGDSLFALSRELKDLCWRPSCCDLYRSCLESAARRGHAAAQRALASLYLHGDIGLPPNKTRGLYWLRKVAAHDAEAAAWLAELEHPAEL